MPVPVGFVVLEFYLVAQAYLVQVGLHVEAVHLSANIGISQREAEYE